MGRHRLHDDATARALLDAAEAIVQNEGLDALTVRRVADDVGASTRAVYSTLGSKPALIAGLGVRAFDTVAQLVDALPRTADPAADLVAAGCRGFRVFAIGHPALFRIGFQLIDVPDESRPAIRDAAGRAMATLHERIERLHEAGGLDRRSLPEAAAQFHALCEGLAAVELRGFLPAPQAKRIWTGGLTALVVGWRPVA